MYLHHPRSTASFSSLHCPRKLEAKEVINQIVFMILPPHSCIWKKQSWHNSVKFLLPFHSSLASSKAWDTCQWPSLGSQAFIQAFIPSHCCPESVSNLYFVYGFCPLKFIPLTITSQFLQFQPQLGSTATQSIDLVGQWKAKMADMWTIMRVDPSPHDLTFPPAFHPCWPATYYLSFEQSL